MMYCVQRSSTHRQLCVGTKNNVNMCAAILEAIYPAYWYMAHCDYFMQMDLGGL